MKNLGGLSHQNRYSQCSLSCWIDQTTGLSWTKAMAKGFAGLTSDAQGGWQQYHFRFFCKTTTDLIKTLQLTVIAKTTTKHADTLYHFLRGNSIEEVQSTKKNKEKSQLYRNDLRLLENEGKWPSSVLILSRECQRINVK